jgi:hypothetical protein
MAFVMDSQMGGSSPSYGEVNIEQYLHMVQDPTDGPFYMVNLIRFRDLAEYADGRTTDLTGREANALYSPLEFIQAIGAEPVFAGQVAWTTLGQDSTWDEVGIVEYPCPLALFAMNAHPDFRDRAVHKDAGLEASIIMVAHPQQLADTVSNERPFPPTADDPSFELVQVYRYRETAEYPAGSPEPVRTGEEAMRLYSSAVRETERKFGVYPKGRLAVEGVFIGDGREWDEVWIDFVPSSAALTALESDSTYMQAQKHRLAALEYGYGLAVYPMLSTLHLR